MLLQNDADVAVLTVGSSLPNLSIALSRRLSSHVMVPQGDIGGKQFSPCSYVGD